MKDNGDPLPQEGPSVLLELTKAVNDRFGVNFTLLGDTLRQCVKDLLSEGLIANGNDVLLRLRASPDSDDVVQRVRQKVCIGETYLFRAPAQLDAVVEAAAEHLFAGDEKPTRLRAWSAGCASGEEAYSIAICLLEAFPNVPIEVLGTDANPEAIKAARTGRYGKRSFRSVSPESLATYLLEVEGKYEFRPELRKLISFHHARLGSGREYPPLRKHGFDIILCRNVLYYMEPARVPGVMARFARVASPRSLVVLSPAEYAASRYLQDFEDLSGGILLRRGTPTKAASPSPQATVLKSEPSLVSATVPDRPRPVQVTSPGLVDEARAAADRGDFDVAEELCQRAVAKDPGDSGAWYWMGFFAASKHNWTAAAERFRRALFLDRELIAAEIGLGQALRQLGHQEDGRAHLLRAQRQLNALPDESMVRELGVRVAVGRRLVMHALT